MVHNKWINPTHGGRENPLIQIKISLHGVFRIDRFREQLCDFPADISAQNIIDDLQIPGKLLGIILINGVHASAEDILHDGDTLMLLPLLEGG